MKNHLRQILRFRDARNWKQFHSPKNLAISLALESAEVLELFQWSPDNRLPTDKKKAVREELADVYYYLLLLAYEAGVDLDKAFADKIRLNAKKYPVSKSRGSSRKYTDL